MFLGPLQEREDIRIVSQEAGWFPAILGLGIVDLVDPKWEEITPSMGPVWIRLWQIARNGSPDVARGGVLAQVLEGERLRIEWFATHQEVAAFSAGASV